MMTSEVIDVYIILQEHTPVQTIWMQAFTET